MTDINSDDKRGAKRVAVNFIVTFRPEDGSMVAHMRIGNKLRIIALMLNLSIKGMAIITEYDIPINTVLVIKFTLVSLDDKRGDQVKSMELVGQVRYNVVWKNMGHRLGISFSEISEYDKTAIIEFVDRAQKQKEKG